MVEAVLAVQVQTLHLGGQPETVEQVHLLASLVCLLLMQVGEVAVGIAVPLMAVRVAQPLLVAVGQVVEQARLQAQMV